MIIHKKLSNKIIVLELAQTKIILSNTNENYKKELIELGFIKENDKFITLINLDDRDRKARLINNLILLESLFQNGKDWSPEAVVKYFRDDLRKIEGKFKMISWLNKDEFIIRLQ